MRLTIGQLAEITREPVKTSRYWTDSHLLPATRGENRYRYYNEDARRFVTFIRSAQRLGFAIGETVQADTRNLRLNLVAHESPGGRGVLEVSALVTPPDQGLLPVIRGRVPWGPTYHLLLRGEADGEPVFTVLVAFGLAR